MPRIDEIRNAVADYGQRSIENMSLCRDFGRQVIVAFDKYLRPEGGVVIGVPPEGDWDPELGDYRDGAFSFFHGKLLTLGDSKFGISVQIDNLKDSGRMWSRIIVTLRKEGDRLGVFVGDSEILWIQLPFSASDIEHVCEFLFEVVLLTYRIGVNVFVHGRGQLNTIGFRQE